MENVQVVPAGTVVTATGNSADFALPGNNLQGAIFFINVSAVSGTTPTLTLQLQWKDPTSGSYVNVPGAVTPTINAAGESVLELRPGATVVANQVLSQPISDVMRIAYTVGGTTPSFTLGVVAQALAS